MKTTRMMAAVMLGTALSAGEAPASSTQAVNGISKYCQACWRNARLPSDHWPDATQQVFVRLLERVDPARWSAALSDDGLERREFLRAIDAVKKRTQRTKKYSPMNDDNFSDRDDNLRDVRSWLDTHSKNLLSTRQQAILDLTVKGHEVLEIAESLNTTVARISDEKYKAIQKLRKVAEAELTD